MSTHAAAPPLILSVTEISTSLSEVRQSHAHILKTGLIASPFAAARLLSSAAAVASPATLSYADSLFSRLPAPNSFAWNTMIRLRTASSDPEAALQLFVQMLRSSVPPDKFTYPFTLKACAALLALREALQIHARVLKTGFGSDIYIQNTLIHLYATAGRIGYARRLLARMPERDVVSWNALISACAAQGLVEGARELFDEMPDRNVESWNFMICGYVSLGLVNHACELFDRMPVRDVVSWNAMITGCAGAGQFEDVIMLFRSMLDEGAHPDECTLVNVLSACARVGALGQGEWVHAYIDKNGIEIGGFVATALVDMYSKCGSIDKALSVFSNALRKDVSTWNAMIEGLSIHGFAKDALKLFEGMQVDGCLANDVTFVSVLSACSHGGLLDEGRQIFNDMAKLCEIKPNIKHYGCMVDLLGRSGQLEEAMELIEQVPVKVASVLWEALLSACRTHGDVGLAELVGKRLVQLNPRDSSCYVQLSNVYASLGRWDDVREVRKKMRTHGVRKEPGSSTIEVNGVVYDFFASD